MKKLVKVIAVLVALILVLLVAGSIALRIYLPPEKAKALVLARLSAQLKREVKLGSASVGILSGLQMEQLKISESPDFSKGTFLSSDQFSLKIALVPLLFRKIIVRQIVLKRPEVAIVRYADGKTFNFSDLTSSTTARAPSPLVGEGKDGGLPPPQSSPTPPLRPGGSAKATVAERGEDNSLPFLLLVSRAEIQKGALHFTDRSPAKQSLDISPLNLILRNVSLTAPFSVQTSFQIKSKGAELAISLAGQADLWKGTFAIKQASLVSRNTKVVLSGGVSRLKTQDPAVDLKIDIPQLNLSDLSAFVALPPTIHIDKPLKGSLSIKGDQKTIDLKTQMSLGSVRLDGHGRVQNAASPKPSVAFHLESNAFPLEEVLAYAPSIVPVGVALKGHTQILADLSGTMTAGQFAAKWVGTDLRISQGDAFAKASGVPLEASVLGDVTSMKPLKVVVKTLAVRLASNQLTGSGTYETRGAQGLINFVARASGWSIVDLAGMSPLLAPYHPTGTLSFEAHASGPSGAPQTSLQTSAEVSVASVKQEFYEGQNLQMKWNLTDVTPDFARVNGTASLKQGPGKILNVEKLAAGSRIGKIALSPIEVLAKLQEKGLLKEVNLPSLQSVSFDSIVGDYVLRNGVMDIKTFDLQGKDLSVQNRGTVGLAGVQPINLSVTMKLAAGAIGGTVGQIINDDHGRPTIKFAATGSVANPQVKLDVQEVGKKALQQVGQEILKNKDVQNAVDDLQKSFKGLFH